MLIEKKKLNKILKDFYTLIGVRIAVFDEWQQEIAAYPQTICDYCKERRAAEIFDERCRASDKNAFERAAETRAQYTYKCHAGLYESVCPIISDGSLLGFLMIGQFIGDGKEGCESNKEFYGSGLKALSADGVEAIASIMSVCAEYLCFSKTVSARRVGLAEKAERYVCEHLSEPVTVREISDFLGVSRAYTHVLFKKYFGKGVIEYVNFKKIEKAKQMIDKQTPTQKIIETINVSDPNYFYRMFKKHTGMSVSEYKRSKI